MRSSWRGALLAVVFGAPCFVWAHGGEDHEHAAPALVTAGLPNVAASTGSVFEVVLKAPPITGEAVTAQIFVAEVASNAPVSGAVVALEAKGDGGFRESVQAQATKTPGIYEVAISLPGEGKFLFDLSVQAGGKADLLSLSGVFAGPAEPSRGGRGSNVSLLLAAAALAAGVGFAVGRLSGRRVSTPKAST
jgi:hypothetical protein